jgi:hypothetical protein
VPLDPGQEVPGSFGVHPPGVVVCDRVEVVEQSPVDVARSRGDHALGIEGRPARQDGPDPEQMLEEVPAPHEAHLLRQGSFQQVGERAALRGQARAGHEPQPRGRELEEKAWIPSKGPEVFA